MRCGHSIPTYCGGIAITGTSNVHFSPGTYVIKDGPFTIAGKSVVDANDVGFYLSGDAALIDFGGQTDISLSGAEDDDGGVAVLRGPRHDAWPAA